MEYRRSTTCSKCNTKIAKGIMYKQDIGYVCAKCVHIQILNNFKLEMKKNPKLKTATIGFLKGD